MASILKHKTIKITQKITTTIILVLIAFSLISTVSAEYVVSQNPYTTADSSIAASSSPNANFPSSSAVTSANAQYFKVDWDNVTLNYVDIWMKKVGSPVSVLRCALYSSDGTKLPISSIELSTTTLQTSTLSTSNNLTRWYFEGTTILYASSDYCIVIYQESETTADSTNYATLWTDGTADYTVYGCSTISRYLSSTWSSFSGSIAFRVWGNNNGNPTAVVYENGNTYYYTTTNENTYEVSVGDVIAEGTVTATGNVTTGAVTVTAETVSAGAVTAGDVTAGDVTAEGTITVEFNNTVVNAGDVNADGAVTATGDINITQTIEGEGGSTSTGSFTAETWNIVFLIGLLSLGVFLTIKSSIPILNFVVGIIMIGVAGYTLTTSPYFGGLLQLGVIIVAVITMVKGYTEVY